MTTPIQQLCEDIHDFWQPLSNITRVDARTLSAFEFYRQYVSKSVPVILTQAMESSQWQQVLRKWQSMDYIKQQAGDTQVTVDITPFGYGDAVLEMENHQYFVMPEERTMSLSTFLELLEDRNLVDGVPYLSHQNDSLRTELPQLFAQVPIAFPLASQAFGNEPEAINLWIGDERAVSTMHKDHYENMYGVVKGTKCFTLLPPAAIACLYETQYISARYAHITTTYPHKEWVEATQAFHNQYPCHRSWHLVPTTTDLIPWIPVDPLAIDTIKYPLAKYLEPLQCTIQPGEVLYLPAMWYHRATQSELTISINYWHDMTFDCRYVYYNYLCAIAQQQ